MKICPRQFKFFSVLLPAFCLGLLLLASPAKADAVITDLPIAAGAIVIPSYEMSGVLYCYNNCQAISIDSAAMSTYGCQATQMEVFYLNNPTAGSHTINKNDTSARCFFVGGLIASTPVSYEAGTPNVDNYDTFNVNRNNTRAGNLVIGFFTAGDSGSGESGTSDSTTATSTTIISQKWRWDWSNDGQYIVAAWQMALESFNNWWIHTERTMYPFFTNKSDFFVELEPYVAPSGVVNPNYQDSSLLVFNDSYNCSNASSCQIRYQYNEDILSSYDYLEIKAHDPITSVTSTSTIFVASSTIFDYPGENYFGKGAGASFIAIVPATSTLSGLAYYDAIVHLAAYYDASTGLDVIPTPSEPFLITVKWSGENIGLGISNYIASSTTDFDTTSMACSPEEWAATETYLGMNFQRQVCNIKKWILDLGIKPALYLQDKVTELKSKILKMFPFSIMSKTKSSWDAAVKDITFLPKTALAEGISTTTGIYDAGNAGDGFSFSIPNFMGIAGTSTFKVFSKADFISVFGDNLFNIYYTVVRVLIWGLLFSYWWYLIVGRTDEVL